jgi:hypothetical protein
VPIRPGLRDITNVVTATNANGIESAPAWDATRENVDTALLAASSSQENAILSAKPSHMYVSFCCSFLILSLLGISIHHQKKFSRRK